MKTTFTHAFPILGSAIPLRRAMPVARRRDEEKLAAGDLLLIAAEVGSTLAICGLLNWVAG